MRIIMDLLLVILGLFFMTDIYAYETEILINTFSTEKPWVIQAIPPAGFDHVIGKVQFGACKVINGPCLLQPYSVINATFTSNRKDNLLLGQLKITDYRHVSMSFTYDNYKMIEVEPKDTKGVVIANDPFIGDISIARPNYRIN